MPDIVEIINARIEEMTKNGVFEEVIGDAVERAVKERVQNVLTGYGDFGRSLEKQIQEACGVDKDLGLPGYHEVLAKIIQRQLHTYFEEKAAKEFEKYINELLDNYPKEVKLSDLIDKFNEYCIAHEYLKQEDGVPTIIVDYSRDHLVDGYFSVHLDPEKGKTKHTCMYELRCNKEGEVWGLHIAEWHSYESGRQLFRGPLFDFEAFLFHAYANRVKIILDEDYYE